MVSGQGQEQVLHQGESWLVTAPEWQDLPKHELFLNDYRRGVVVMY